MTRWSRVRQILLGTACGLLAASSVAAIRAPRAQSAESAGVSASSVPAVIERFGDVRSLRAEADAIRAARAARERAMLTPQQLRTRAAVDRGRCGATGSRVVRFRVLIDDDVPAVRERFVRDLLWILCDPRGWKASGRVGFRYDPKGPVLISLRTAAATERRCLRLVGLSVGYRFSCAGAREAVLNADRWLEGSATWPGSVARYRRLLVNHEVGHVIGHGHRGCPRRGARAPAMMQQSKGLGGCRANEWPVAYELAATR